MQPATTTTTTTTTNDDEYESSDDDWVTPVHFMDAVIHYIYDPHSDYASDDYLDPSDDDDEATDDEVGDYERVSHEEIEANLDQYIAETLALWDVDADVDTDADVDADVDADAGGRNDDDRVQRNARP